MNVWSIAFRRVLDDEKQNYPPKGGNPNKEA
jgi:hypothetical protein